MSLRAKVAILLTAIGISSAGISGINAQDKTGDSSKHLVSQKEINRIVDEGINIKKFAYDEKLNLVVPYSIIESKLENIYNLNNEDIKNILQSITQIVIKLNENKTRNNKTAKDSEKSFDQRTKADQNYDLYNQRHKELFEKYFNDILINLKILYRDNKEIKNFKFKLY